ncbi:unnamed protein product, partial [Brassica oleracea]
MALAGAQRAWIALSKNPSLAREAIAIAIWYLRTN